VNTENVSAHLSQAAELLARHQGVRDTQKLLTRTRITEAAREIFSEKGFRAATIEEIARRANVGRTTIYTHFKDKTDMANEIGLREIPGLTERLSNLASVDINDLDSLSQWLAGYEEAFQTHLVDRTVAFQANVQEPKLAADLLLVLDEFARIALDGLTRKASAQAHRAPLRLFLLTLNRVHYIHLAQQVETMSGDDEAMVRYFQHTLRQCVANIAADEA